MTSKRYNNKHLIADVKKNLRYTRPLWILLIAASVLLTFYSAYSVLSDSLPLDDFIRYRTTSSLHLLGFTFVINCVFSFLMVTWLFSYLYSQKNLDVYHSLPISRSTYIASRFLTILLPMAFSCMLQILAPLFVQVFLFKKLIAVSFSSLLGGALAGFATALAFTAVLIFCAVHAKSILKYIYYVVGTTAILPLGILLLLRLPQQHITGFSVNDTLVGYFFPLANSGLVVAGQGNTVLQTLSMLAVCAVMLILSIKMYTKSNRETMTSRTAIGAVQFGAQLFSLAFFSQLMRWLLLDEYTTLKVLRTNPILSILLGTFLAFAVTALLELLLTSNRNFKKAFVQVALVSGVLLCFAFGLQFVGPRYEERMPALEDIQSITFTDHVNGKDNANSLALEAVDSLPQTTDLLAIQGDVTLETQDSFKKALALHEESVSFFQYRHTPDTTLTYTITYHLKNNKKITRTLAYIRETFMSRESSPFSPIDGAKIYNLADAYYSCITSNEVLQKGSVLFKTPAEDLLAVDIEGLHSVQTVDPIVAHQLLEALKKDVLESGLTPDSQTTKYLPTNDPTLFYTIPEYLARLRFCYKKTDLGRNVFAIDSRSVLSYEYSLDGKLTHDFYEFDVPTHFQNTLAFLHKNSLLK